MKGKLLLFMTLLMLVSLLAACGPGASPTQKPGELTEAPSALPPPTPIPIIPTPTPLPPPSGPAWRELGLAVQFRISMRTVARKKNMSRAFTYGQNGLT
jgi:hypothetical protein